MRDKRIRFLGGICLALVDTFSLSVVLSRQKCPSNSYILKGNSGGKIMVETGLGFVN